MGYMDITIEGSDHAAGAYSEVRSDIQKAADRSIKRLRKELKDMANSYNTAGPVNVAMILTETDAPLHFSPDYREFLQQAIDAMAAYIATAKDPEVWDDLGNRDWHLKRYRQLLGKLRRKQAKLPKEDDDDYDD